MDVAQRSWAALACLVIAGCHGGVETDLLERQLRLQEDHIYQLEDLIEQYQMQLDACRQPTSAAEPAKSVGDRDRKSSAEPRKQQRDDTPDEIPSIDDIRPPVVEPGIQVEPEAERLPEPSLPAPSAEEVGEQSPAGGESAERASNSPPAVQRIVLNPTLSGGLDRDGRPGSDGVVAVLEARSADDKPAQALGQVSFLVINPQKAGADGRVARWDFSLIEVEAMWKDSGPHGPLHLELPWPQRAPNGGPLQLWARLVTPDGRKLLASLDLDPNTPLRVSAANRRGPNGHNQPADRFTARSADKRSQAPGWSQRQDRNGQLKPPARTSQPLTTPATPPASKSARTAAQPTSPTGPPILPNDHRPVWTPHR